MVTTYYNTENEKKIDAAGSDATTSLRSGLRRSLEDLDAIIRDLGDLSVQGGACHHVKEPKSTDMIPELPVEARQSSITSGRQTHHRQKISISSCSHDVDQQTPGSSRAPVVKETCSSMETDPAIAKSHAVQQTPSTNTPEHEKQSWMKRLASAFRNNDERPSHPLNEHERQRSRMRLARKRPFNRFDAKTTRHLLDASHSKMAGSERPLRQQVLITNFYSHLVVQGKSLKMQNAPYRSKSVQKQTPSSERGRDRQSKTLHHMNAVEIKVRSRRPSQQHRRLYEKQNQDDYVVRAPKITMDEDDCPLALVLSALQLDQAE